MQINIRRALTVTDTQYEDAGLRAATPLLKVAEVLVVGNPHAGRFVDGFKPLVDASPALGCVMAERLLRSLHGATVQGYGKAVLVGSAGEA